MTPDDLRAMIDYLRERVELTQADTNEITVAFEMPSDKAMVNAGLHADGVSCLISQPWLKDMVTDIIETPDFCDEEDTSDQVLEYARDVVSDYMRKRFPLSDV